jgi:Na+/melibiose symporter-like transporter
VTWAGLAAVLVPALGIAWSPVPLEALLAMLRTERPRSLGALFTIGFGIGIALLGYVVLLLAGVGNYAEGSPTYRRVGWLQIVLGIVLWLLAVHRWRQRPPTGQPDEPPAWVREVETFTALRAVGVAVPLALASPKNVVLALVAMIAVAALPTGSGAAYLAFVLLACSALLLMVLVDLPSPQGLGPRLDSWREWIGRHNTAIAVTSLFLLGAVVVTRGLEALAR